jgi:hypothetical protein
MSNLNFGLLLHFIVYDLLARKKLGQVRWSIKETDRIDERREKTPPLSLRAVRMRMG